MKNQVYLPVLFLSVWILYGVQDVQSCNVIRQEGPAIRGRYVRLMVKSAFRHSASSVKWIIFYNYKWINIERYPYNYTRSEINGYSVLDILVNRTFIINADVGCRMVTVTPDGHERCGIIRHVEPAIQGRYVRFMASPASTNHARNPVVWNIYYNNAWSTIANYTTEYNETEINGEFILDVKLTTERIYIYADFGCRTPTYEISLEYLELQKCGKLYLEPKQYKPGDDIKIRYFPARSITLNPGDFTQTWRVINGSCAEPLGCVVSERQGMFKMTTVMFYNDLEHILEIMWMSADRDGTYFLQCDVSKTTDRLEIVTSVAPRAVSVESKGSLDEIKDVYTLDVTCTLWQFSAECQPEWKIDNETKPYSIHSSLIESGTNMKNYTQSVYITVTKSDNRKQLTCLAKCEGFSSHKSDSIAILLPCAPRAVSVESKGSLDEIKDVYTLDVTCTLWQFSAECQPEWKIDNETKPYSIHSSPIESGTNMKNYTQSVYITVTKSDNRKQLTCLAKCEGFSSHKSDSIAILLPYEPILSLDTPQRVNVYIGETFETTCIADSYPGATVNWYSDSMVESPHNEACGYQWACLRLEPVTRNHSGQYYCVAKNKLSNQVQQILTVTVLESKEENVLDKKKFPTTLVSAVGSSVAVVILFVVIAVVFVKKDRMKPPQEETSDIKPGRNEDETVKTGNATAVSSASSLQRSYQQRFPLYNNAYHCCLNNRDSDKNVDITVKFEALGATDDKRLFTELQTNETSGNPNTNENTGNYEALSAPDEKRLYTELHTKETSGNPYTNENTGNYEALSAPDEKRLYTELHTKETSGNPYTNENDGLSTYGNSQLKQRREPDDKVQSQGNQLTAYENRSGNA